MPWTKGFNFRATSGYVTDGVNETYVISTDTYPTIRNGVTFGREDAFGFFLDRLNTNDRRLAGVMGDATDLKRFRVDLPGTGSVSIRLALGDPSSAQSVRWVTKDNVTTLDTYIGTPPANSFIDASGVTRTAAAWPGSNVAVTRSFASQIFRLQTTGASGTSVVAHITLEMLGEAVAAVANTITFSAPEAAGPLISTYEFFIDGLYYGDSEDYFIEKGSFRFTETLGSRNTGSIGIMISMLRKSGPGGTELTIQHGQRLYVYKNSTLVFGGRLRQPSRRMYGVGQTYKKYTAAIVDHSEVFDRRLITAVYENKTLKEIVDGINDVGLSGEFFNTSGVETGPTIKKIVFSYKTVTQAFNELVKRTGYSYWVSNSKVIHFKARTSVVGNPLNELNAFNYVATQNVEGYRNVQYLRGGLDLTDPRSETFVGDGVRRTFSVGFPIGKVPTVEVNTGAGYVVKTIGIKGLDTGFDWYWSKGSPEITQDAAGAVLTTAHNLRVTFRGQFPISISRENITEIASRSFIESGDSGTSSGRYEAAEEDRSLDDAAASLDKVLALLARHGMIADVITCSTYDDGYHAGQLVTITHTQLPASGSYLIETVDVHPISPSVWRYDIRAVGGNAVGEWQEFFLRLAALGQGDVLQENEILLLSSSKTDNVVTSDSLTYTTAVPETRAGFAIVGTGEAG